MFHDYLETYEVRDCRRALIELFKVLDTPISDRDEYLEEDLAQFPYVNGGLFADETIEIPPLQRKLKNYFLQKRQKILIGVIFLQLYLEPYLNLH